MLGTCGTLCSTSELSVTVYEMKLLLSTLYRDNVCRILFVVYRDNNAYGILFIVHRDNACRILFIVYEIIYVEYFVVYRYNICRTLFII